MSADLLMSAVRSWVGTVLKNSFTDDKEQEKATDFKDKGAVALPLP
jgi:hypothetical protein